MFVEKNDCGALVLYHEWIGSCWLFFTWVSYLMWHHLFTKQNRLDQSAIYRLVWLKFKLNCNQMWIFLKTVELEIRVLETNFKSDEMKKWIQKRDKLWHTNQSLELDLWYGIPSVIRIFCCEEDFDFEHVQ